VPADRFTGTVRIDPMFGAVAPDRVQGALATFEPGARTARQIHPLGQIQVVTSGLGRVQREGGSMEPIRPGDVVWFEAGERGRHGAASDTAMPHLAFQEVQDGRAVTWLDPPTDAVYHPASRA
jgi:quercetin dioxygenase-like cupin family protein